MALCQSEVARLNTAYFSGAGTNYFVETNSGVLYVVYVDVNTDVAFKKSSDGGLSWSTPTVVFTGTATSLAVWYDRWSNISAGLIHLAYQEAVTDDTLYRSIDTESSDTLSTQTSIFAGTTTAAGGALSITRARGGNLYCKTMIDAGAEGGFFRSTDVGATWGARTDSEALATTDQWILLPGWAADNQDIMMFFWDASADEISRVLHDDSADTWAETSIATTMVDVLASSTFPHFAAAVDITNSRNLLAAWSAVDLLNADLRVWHVTESAITEVTNVVTNSTDDQGFVAIAINTANEDWYVYYAGITTGGETFSTSLNIYYKSSTDDGANWGSETLFSHVQQPVSFIFGVPRFSTEKAVLIGSSNNTVIIANVDVPAASGGGGNNVLGARAGVIS